jgi:pyruvate dehydrogenase E2 component (dihydrolipoamide acetyltransferase)
VPTLIRMPAVAAGATEVVLAEWPVAEKEAFAAHQTYAVIETDKAVVDLEAEADGVLVRALVPAGAKVEVGDPIALVAAPGEQVDDVEAALSALGISTPDAPDEHVFPERREVPEPAAAPVAAPAADRRVFASPLARRLSRDAGLATADLVGTGPGGRVVRRDVERAIAARHTGAEATVATAPVPAPTTVPSAPASTGTTEVPHTRLRRAVATRLTQSKQQAPHFYVSGSARVDRLLALRAEVVEATGTKVSVNDLVVRAV